MNCNTQIKYFVEYVFFVRSDKGYQQNSFFIVLDLKGNKASSWLSIGLSKLYSSE